jgi:CubicO group peptidase (beta-lactamase class C family)
MKSTLLCLIVYLQFIFCAPVSAQSLKRLDNSRIGTAELDHRIRQLIDSAGVAGLEIVVFNKKKPVYTRTFGYANEQIKTPLDTSYVFYSASFSKAVFAYIVMQQVDKKKIALDTPLISYLPKPLYEYSVSAKCRGYSDLRGDNRFKKITARMCLAHTSGLPNYRESEPDQKLHIKAEPGTRYLYSGEGMQLLQFVTEQVTGSDLESLARENVFIPLGMSHSSYVWQPRYERKCCSGHDKFKKTYEQNRKTTARADASLYTSAADYAKFYAILLQKKGLRKASYKEMFSKQIPVKGLQQFGANALIDAPPGKQDFLSYGLGLGLLDTPYGTAFFKEGHDAGWQHYSIGFPDKGIAVIIMSNSDNAERIFNELLELTIADTFTPTYWENYISLNKTN